MTDTQCRILARGYTSRLGTSIAHVRLSTAAWRARGLAVVPAVGMALLALAYKSRLDSGRKPLRFC